MTMIHRTRFRGQCGSGSGGATEDVTRGTVGNGEQEGSSSSRNPAGVGTVTMEEAEDMVPLGEVPLDDVLGLGHGRGNYSSGVQQVAKWMEQIIPFSLLLFIVIVRQHWKGFFVTTCVSAVMFMSNEFVKKQTALKGDRKVSVLLGISFVFMLYVICIYWWYRNDDLLYQLAMFPPKATPPFWHTIFIILVNDALMRQAAMAFKCLLLIYYKNRGGQNFGQQGQMLTLVEYTLLLYRALLPTPVWCRFLLNKDSGSLFSSVTTVLYVTLKLIFVVDKVHCFLRSLKALSKKEVHYGVYATMEQDGGHPIGMHNHTCKM
ncbi:hypothetical protein SESBI_39918 [Sesbania bispinosa]|nr:hypothetical protein SESBI_39918 [Sesbania bispinosa]